MGIYVFKKSLMLDLLDVVRLLLRERGRGSGSGRRGQSGIFGCLLSQAARTPALAAGTRACMPPCTCTPLHACSPYIQTRSIPPHPTLRAEQDQP